MMIVSLPPPPAFGFGLAKDRIPIWVVLQSRHRGWHWVDTNFSRGDFSLEKYLDVKTLNVVNIEKSVLKNPLFKKRMPPTSNTVLYVSKFVNINSVWIRFRIPRGL